MYRSWSNSYCKEAKSTQIFCRKMKNTRWRSLFSLTSRLTLNKPQRKPVNNKKSSKYQLQAALAIYSVCTKVPQLLYTCRGAGPAGSCTIFFVTSTNFLLIDNPSFPSLSGQRCNLIPEQGIKFVTRTKWLRPSDPYISKTWVFFEEINSKTFR